MEKAAIEKELINIDKEIDTFKKQLDINKKRFSEQTKGSHLSMYKRVKPYRNRQQAINRQITPVTHKHKVNTDIFPNIVTKQEEEISKELVNDTLAVNVTSTEFSNLKSLPCTSNTNSIKKIKMDILCTNKKDAGKLLYQEITDTDLAENFKKLHIKKNGFYNKQNLIHNALNKWKRFTLKNKLLRVASKIREEECQERNKALLRKHWDIWFEYIQKKKKILNAAHKKLKTEEKIDNFLKVLQEQKQALVLPALMKDLENINKVNSNPYPNKLPTKLAKYKNKTTEIYGRSETKSAPSQLNIRRDQRFQAQQNIIAEQKSKLMEQSKLITKLQLEQLRLQTENSTKQLHEEINRTLSNCDLSLKPKVIQIQARLSTADGRLETSERKYTVKSLRINPPILTKMEERAQEREKRRRMIQEKKLMRIKEKEKLEKEEEMQRRRKEEIEKRQKIEELREKRRLEKEMEIQKIKEKKRLAHLRSKASLYYRRKLLKRGMKAMYKLLQQRRQQTAIAEEHGRAKLLFTSFYIWWKYIHKEYRIRCQVAVDFYDFHLQERIFISWQQVTCAAYMETIFKLGKANAHFNRVLLRHYFNKWVNLPFVMQLEREKEKRKQIMRRKVQELLPDYDPHIPVFDDYFKR
ncbi:hypothetical protein C0J52_09749 [Blattella germanica]|nr:hypothetical protein C0J52_09749 [Blattella germanica]